MTDGSFEDELDNYIAERRSSDRRLQRRGFFSRLFSSWQRQDEQDDRSEREAELEDIEDDIEVIDEEERELEEVREGLISRFLKLLRSDSANDVEGELPEEPVEEDTVEEPEPELVDKALVKEVIQIQHKWIEELPRKDLSRFKRHEDYDRYTFLLDELGLIADDQDS